MSPLDVFSIDLFSDVDPTLQYVIVAGFVIWQLRNAPAWFRAIHDGWVWARRLGFSDIYGRVCKLEHRVTTLEERHDAQ